jgi:hypothetical protein
MPGRFSSVSSRLGLDVALEHRAEKWAPVFRKSDAITET